MNREGYGGTLEPLFDAYDKDLIDSVDFLRRAAERAELLSGALANHADHAGSAVMTGEAKRLRTLLLVVEGTVANLESRAVAHG